MESSWRSVRDGGKRVLVDWLNRNVEGLGWTEGDRLACLFEALQAEAYLAGIADAAKVADEKATVRIGENSVGFEIGKLAYDAEEDAEAASVDARTHLYVQEGGGFFMAELDLSSSRRLMSGGIVEITDKDGRKVKIKQDEGGHTHVVAPPTPFAILIDIDTAQDGASTETTEQAMFRGYQAEVHEFDLDESEGDTGATRILAFTLQEHATLMSGGVVEVSNSRGQLRRVRWNGSRVVVLKEGA